MTFEINSDSFMGKTLLIKRFNSKISTPVIQGVFYKVQQVGVYKVQQVRVKADEKRIFFFRGNASL